MDPLTIGLILGGLLLLTRKPVTEVPPTPPTPPTPTPAPTQNIAKALGVGVVVAGVVAGIDAIGDALETDEQTFDWKHQIRDVLLSGKADHLFVINPNTPLHQQVLLAHTRANLRPAYDFVHAIHPRPSGVHDPFVHSDAWGWYTDYWARAWNQVQEKIVVAKQTHMAAMAMKLAAPVQAAPEAPVVAPELIAAQEQVAAMADWWVKLGLSS